MTQQNTPVTAAQNERLVHLIEECGEVIQAACKVQRFGWNGRWKDGPHAGKANFEVLEHEMGDVRAGMIILVKAGDVRKDVIHKQADLKQEKFKQNQVFQE